MNNPTTQAPKPQVELADIFRAFAGELGRLNPTTAESHKPY